MKKIFENWRNFRKKTLLNEKGVAPLDHKAILHAATREAAKEAVKQGATKSILRLILQRAGGILGFFWPSELADATLSPEQREAQRAAQERIAREAAKKVQQSPQTVEDVIKNADIIEFPGPRPEIIPGPWKDQPKKVPVKPDDVPDWFWDMVTRNRTGEEEQNTDKKERCKDRIRKKLSNSSKLKALDKVLEELTKNHGAKCEDDILKLAINSMQGSGIDTFDNLEDIRKDIKARISKADEEIERLLDECRFALPDFNPNYIDTVNADIMCQFLCLLLNSKRILSFLPSKPQFGSSACWGIKQTIREMLAAGRCNCNKPKEKERGTLRDPTGPKNLSPLFPKK